MKRIINLIGLFVLTCQFSFAQKGPGGVQNTDGTTNLRLWLDADEINGIISGNNVSVWKDLSGYGNDVSQSSSNVKPNWFSNAVNGFPYVSFDGGERLEGMFDVAPQAPMTVIAVAFFDSLNQSAANPDYVVSFGDQNGTNTRMSIARHSAGVDGNKYFTYDGANTNLGPVIPGQQWTILAQTQSPSAPYHDAFIDGTNVVVDDFAAGPLSTTSVFRVGDDSDSPGPAFMLAGKIPEVIVFDKLLNTSERNIVNAYLGAKYNITVSDDQYAGDNPANGDNDRGVIGLGVEADGSNMEAHADGIQLSVNSGFENGDYLLAGHSVEVNSINTADVGGGYDARWDRAYWFDVTDAGGAATADITFDYSESGLGSIAENTNISNYQLVFRAANSGAWTTIASASAVSVDQVLFSNVSITADGYYTLATLDNTTHPLGTEASESSCLGPGGVGDTDGTTNLKLWLNTQFLNGRTGDPLVTYLDYSGNANHATLFNNANIPSITSDLVNGNAAATFDGNDYIEGTLDVNLSADATVISVGYFNANQGAGDNDYLVSVGAGTTANQNLSISRRRNDVAADANKYYSWTGSSVVLGPVINQQEWNIFYQEQVTTGGFHNLYINGTSQAVGANPAVYSSSSPTYRIGMWQNANNSGLNGYSAETIIFNRQLNLAERNIINSYLGAKYDLTVGGDQYTGDDALNGEHDIFVAGVGTEADGTNTCANSGGMIISQNSGYENGDYLMIGISKDTNSVDTIDIAETTSSITGRWERVWWADVTDAGTGIRTDVTFDFSDAGNMGFPDGLPSNYSLIYRAGTSGVWTIIATAVSVSGDQVSFSNVPITNDGYYTLATNSLIGNPLPVELVSFDAIPVTDQDISNQYVRTIWVTASEINNDYFTVERSSDGLNFQGIGYVQGAGNSSAFNNYEWHDMSPLTGQTSYYRLKQTDFDGTTSYSNIVAVELNGLEILNIYPNPSVNQIDIVLASSSDTELDVSIISSVGTLVMARQVQVEEGVSTFRIPIQSLSDGLYTIRAVTGDGQHFTVKQFLKGSS